MQSRVAEPSLALPSAPSAKASTPFVSGVSPRTVTPWALGGTTDKSTIPGEPIGTWSAVIVREGSPQQIAIWFSGDAPAGSDCAGFLASHAFADLGPEAFEKVESGALVPPPGLAP